MNAGASINSKAPCHLYSSRLAGGRGEKIHRGFPGRASLYVIPEIFYRESTFLNTVDPGLKIAGVTKKGQ